MKADEFPGIYVEGPSPIQLIEELKYRGMWYCKGFSSILTTLLGNAYQVVTCNSERYRKGFSEGIVFIRGIYSSIPFADLNKENHPDLDLLELMRGYVECIEKEADDILGGKKDLEGFVTTIKSLNKEGHAYETRLAKLIHQIQTYPGYENFGFKTTDCLGGKLWHHPILIPF